MHRKEYQPNPVIVDRAVELWVRALHDPIYDAGIERDNSKDATLAFVMHKVVSHRENINNQDDEVLAKFADALKELLLNKQPHTHNPEYTRYITHLSVDYEECAILRLAAEQSGLKMTFPCKSSMDFDEESVSFKVGYGVPYKHHYPLANGSWLITSLSGGDISAIINHYNTGAPLELNIETSKVD